VILIADILKHLQMEIPIGEVNGTGCCGDTKLMLIGSLSKNLKWSKESPSEDLTLMSNGVSLACYSTWVGLGFSCMPSALRIGRCLILKKDS